MKNDFYSRIDQLTEKQQAKYGKMTVQQMVCHCTDFYRLVLKELEVVEKRQISAREAIEKAKSKQTVPAPQEIDQALGNGTAPASFEEDKDLLKTYLKRFYALDKTYAFQSHFYFGKLNREEWLRVADYHLNHHLKQFGV